MLIAARRGSLADSDLEGRFARRDQASVAPGPSPHRERCRVESNGSDLVVGLMMAVFGLIGLFLVAGAMDIEMYVFGVALSQFAIVFDFGLIKRHFDRRDAASATIREQTHV
jgi:hypothetical protein